MSKEERYYFDGNDYIVDRQKLGKEEDVTICAFDDWNGIIDFMNKQDKQLADLEAKLAESETRISNLKEANNTFSFIGDYITKYLDKREFTFKDIEDFFKSFEKLKQQLAEKEEKIEELNDKLQWKSKWLKLTDNYVSQLKTDNQDKISFAIEKLKEAKRLLEEKYTYDVEESDFAVVYETDIDEIIDNQIEELKKEMK